MKYAFTLAMMILLAACNGCDQEDEEYTPYPGGKTKKIDAR